MFRRKRQTLLETALTNALLELSVQTVGSEEYMETLSIVTRLQAMVEEDKSSSLSRDTLATILGNLMGILLIIGHERAHVISRNAIGLLLRPRI